MASRDNLWRFFKITQKDMPQKETEQCPNCSNINDNYFMGTGEGFALYYHCSYCGNDFIIDGSKYLNEDYEKEANLLDETPL
jgi:DNA-directed RNA polymerase subunit RPC12/RpoP